MNRKDKLITLLCGGLSLALYSTGVERWYSPLVFVVGWNFGFLISLPRKLFHS